MPLRSTNSDSRSGDGPDGSLGHWFLTGPERSNPATCLPPWSTGNSVQVLAHGREYFPVLVEELAQSGLGDLVLLVGWRTDPDELLTDAGPTLAEALSRAALRGALVKGLVWRSHSSRLVGSLEQNRALARAANRAGAELLLDHRVRAAGSHHQKFVVIRRRGGLPKHVAYVGGLDLARSRRDDHAHRGDPQPREFAAVYGDTPAWHDLQLALRGPVVSAVEEVFRERWADPSLATRLPWHRIPDRLRRLPQRGHLLPDRLPEPDRAGTCHVQLLRTYPKRTPGYPFAPEGERSVAVGYAKALNRARRSIYIEDQYLWSSEVAQIFAEALRRAPQLHVLAVAPRFPDQEGRVRVSPSLLGQAESWRVVREAGGDRVQLFNLENDEGRPIYVHAKVCIIDDVWATVGSANMNRRSWTHDSELAAAVVDAEPDGRDPVDPAGLGDGARHFARELRLQLLREHLGRSPGDDADLLDPDAAVVAVRRSAAALDAWYDSDRSGPRPPGRLRAHTPPQGRGWQRLLVAPAYHLVFDPDGRPLATRLRKRN